jgi:ribosomal protein L11 methyltransferase
VSGPDRWLVLSARVPADDPLRDLLAEGLLALGGMSVEERSDSLITYLPPSDDGPDAFLPRASSFLMEWLLTDEPPELTWRWQDNEDWEREWKRGLAPRQVTDRIVVKPSWTAWDAEAGQIVIDIDPQMAFGTGEHGTTRGCLRLLDGAVRPEDRVLDVGSGSAILSIAAARLGAAEVVAVEYDEDANINARENIESNGVGDRVRLVETMADPAVLGELGRFDLVVANILSGVIRPLLPAFRRALGDGTDGRLIVSGILLSEHEDVLVDAAAAGFRVERVEPEDEWWSALLVPAG